MNEPLGNVRDVETDIETAWSITTSTLQRRRRRRGVTRGIGAAACVALVAGGTLVALRSGDDRAAVTVQPGPTTTMTPTSTIAPASTIPSTGPALAGIMRFGHLIPADRRLALASDVVAIRASPQRHTKTMLLTNVSDEPIELGTALNHLMTYITNERGEVVGGTASEGNWTGPGRDYGELGPGEPSAVKVSFNGATGGMEPQPLPPGSYLLWLELPRLPHAPAMVAGPLPVTVVPTTAATPRSDG